MDEQAFDQWCVQESPEVTFEDLSGHIHPTDRDGVRAAFAATRAILGPYEIDSRIMAGRDARWTSARGQGDDADIEGRVMFGVFLNVTGHKQAEEGTITFQWKDERVNIDGAAMALSQPTLA